MPVRSSIRLELDGAEVPKVCGACGYDLRGSLGEKCPECGSAIAKFARRPGAAWERAFEWLEEVDPSCPACGGSVQEGRCVECRTLVSSARTGPGDGPDQPGSRRVLQSFDSEPIELVRTVQRRALLAALLVAVSMWASLAVTAGFGQGLGGGGLSRPVGVIVSLISVLAGPLAPISREAFGAIGLVCLAVPTAVWMLTRPILGAVTASPLLGRGSRVRLLARWASLAWLLVTPFAFGVAFGGDRRLVWGFLVAMPLALATLAPINMHFRNLAAWMVDERADRCFNLALWCSLLAPLVPLGALLGGGFVLLMAAAGLAAAVAYYGTAIGLGLLAGSAWWSVRHAQERQRREARRLARAGQRFAAQIERMRGSDPTT